MTGIFQQLHFFPPGEAARSFHRRFFHQFFQGVFPGRGFLFVAQEEGCVEGVDKGIHHRTDKSLLPGEGKGRIGLGTPEVFLQAGKFVGEFHFFGDEEQACVAECFPEGGPAR